MFMLQIVNIVQNQIQEQEISPFMHNNSSFPFNQKEHIFDFKVKVDFQNGNISLTAPQGITPPASFNRTNPNFNQQQQIQQQNSREQTHFNPHPINNNPNPYISQPSYNNRPPLPMNSNNQMYTPHKYVPPVSSPPPNYSERNVQMNQFQQQYALQQRYSNQQANVQMVSSAYTSMLVKSPNISNSFSEYSQIMNQSAQMVECCICQRTFSANEFDEHLQFHKNRSNQKDNQNYKGNASNNMITQNSFNSEESSSYLSEQHSNDSSIKESSYQSSKKSGKQGDRSKNYSNGSKDRLNNSDNNSPLYEQLSPSNRAQKPIIGVIQNPIFALNAQQQTSNHNSLNYSSNNSNYQFANNANLQNHSLSSYSNGSVIPHQLIANPYHNMSIGSNQNYHNNSSFGNGRPVCVAEHHNQIGPSFYQNSGSGSLNNSTDPRNRQFTKGSNRVGNYQARQLNSSIGSNHMNQYQTSQPQPFLNDPSLVNQSHQNNVSKNSSHHSNNHLNEFANDGYNPKSQQIREIESKYVKQQQFSNPMARNNQSYSSSQQNKTNQKNKSKNHEMLLDSSLSSISSRAQDNASQDFSHDFSGFDNIHGMNHFAEQNAQNGYNSADSSLMKNRIAERDEQDRKIEQMHHNSYSKQSNGKKVNQSVKNQSHSGNFYKKKSSKPKTDDYLINSATSYYDRKFIKQGNGSSSSDEGLQDTRRLSYAQRLKEKKKIDEYEGVSQTRSMKSTKKSKHSHKMGNSNYSQTDSLSKTKIPVNYLARQQFIEQVVSSKSTHKSTQPN